MQHVTIRHALAAALVFCAADASAAVIFEQNFSGGTLASVTGTGVNQFSSMTQGAGADPHAISVVNNAINFKNAVDTSYPQAMASGTNFGGTLGSSMFKLSFTTAPVATVSAGNTAVSVYVVAGGRQVRLDLRVQGTSGSPSVQPRAEGGQTLSMFTGPVDILIYGNSTALPLAYTAPNGSAQVVGTNEWDVWAGTSSFSLAVPLATTANSDRLQFQIPGWSGANGTVSVDNLRLEVIPEPAAIVSVLGLAGLTLRRRRNGEA